MMNTRPDEVWAQDLQEGRAREEALRLAFVQVYM